MVPILPSLPTTKSPPSTDRAKINQFSLDMPLSFTGAIMPRPGATYESIVCLVAPPIPLPLDSRQVGADGAADPPRSRRHISECSTNSLDGTAKSQV